MLPDAQENLSKYFGSDAFPWFGAIAGGVFLFMFSIEFVFHGKYNNNLQYWPAFARLCILRRFGSGMCSDLLIDFMKYFEEKQAEVPEEGNIQTCDDCKVGPPLELSLTLEGNVSVQRQRERIRKYRIRFPSHY